MSAWFLVLLDFLVSSFRKKMLHRHKNFSMLFRYTVLFNILKMVNILCIVFLQGHDKVKYIIIFWDDSLWSIRIRQNEWNWKQWSLKWLEITIKSCYKNTSCAKPLFRKYANQYLIWKYQYNEFRNNNLNSFFISFSNLFYFLSIWKRIFKNKTFWIF